MKLRNLPMPQWWAYEAGQAAAVRDQFMRSARIADGEARCHCVKIARIWNRHRLACMKKAVS